MPVLMLVAAERKCGLSGKKKTHGERKEDSNQPQDQKHGTDGLFVRTV
jgi:hypothetical protein